MSLLTFENIGITGVSGVVPRNVVKNIDYEGPLSKKEIEKAIENTGIKERRIVDSETFTSDLFFTAADNLLNELNIDRDSINMFICVTQTPDYRQPPVSTILQHRLGLAKSSGAYDINLACAGYIYGLSTAFAYASIESVNRILLVVGETSSRMVSQKDRTTSLLFGDGAAASLIEKKPTSGKSYFSLNTDGQGEEALKIKGGGYRFPSSPNTIEMKQQTDGSLRSEEHLRMDGVEVFKFTMHEVVKDIRRVLNYSGVNIDSVDNLVFHQSNKFMTDHFIKKLKFNSEKVPYSIEKFGNTSSASIPLTIVSELKEEINQQDTRLLMSGYGGGLSWGTALLNFKQCKVLELLEI